MNHKKLYYAYSDYLKNEYGEKVYKLPVNLPVSCPNRVDGKGCIFCADVGTGFEASDAALSVTEQLNASKEKVSKRYNAHKFIAYFQNYTNTYLPINKFENYVMEAAQYEEIVELAISTRPDCIAVPYLDILKNVKETYNKNICIELGLQTVNYHTLDSISRGHGLAEFLDAVRMIQQYGFQICVHIILNLPGDSDRDGIETAKVLSALKIDMVKIHSLYIAKNSILCEQYLNNHIQICSKEEYIHRLANFLAYLSPDIVIERLFSRIPESDSVFSNWDTSWWKLKDEVEEYMLCNDLFQGKFCNYLGGSALHGIE